MDMRVAGAAGDEGKSGRVMDPRRPALKSVQTSALPSPRRRSSEMISVRFLPSLTARSLISLRRSAGKLSEVFTHLEFWFSNFLSNRERIETNSWPGGWTHASQDSRDGFPWLRLLRRHGNHRRPRRSENDDGGGKRRRELAALERHSSPDESDFALHHVVVPPTGVGARGQEGHDRGSLKVCLVGLLHPQADRAPVGWIHEDRVLAPVLGEAVQLAGEEMLALRVGWGRSGIHSEPEFVVECGVKPLRRRPFIRCRTEEDRIQGAHCRLGLETNALGDDVTGSCRGCESRVSRGVAVSGEGRFSRRGAEAQGGRFLQRREPRGAKGRRRLWRC